MHNGNSNLRKLALQAKRRLNGAYSEKQNCPKKNLNTAMIYKNLYKNNFKLMAYKSDEEEFYLKVKKSLTIHPDNPTILHELVDYEKFSALDDAQKMAYMLDLAEKLARAKKRLHNEQQNVDLHATM